MSRHVVVYPSADPRLGLRRAAEWQAKGYEVLIGLDADKMCAERAGGPHLFCLASPWTGYYGVNGINTLVKHAFKELGADLISAPGDDMRPVEQGAEVHTAMYFKRFPEGEGLMQCTGDRQGEIINGLVNAERICGSPTFGKGWHARAFGGTGGFPEGFHAFYADELLLHVASKLGLLYQERALKIDHEHWSYNRGPKRHWHEDNSRKWWAQDRATFDVAASNGFANYLSLFK